MTAQGSAYAVQTVKQHGVVQVRARVTTDRVYGIDLKGPAANTDAKFLKRLLQLATAQVGVGLLGVICNTVYDRLNSDGGMNIVDIISLLVTLLALAVVGSLPWMIRKKPDMALRIFTVLSFCSIFCSLCTLTSLILGVGLFSYRAKLCEGNEGTSEVVDDSGKTLVLNCTMVRNPLVYFAFLLNLCLICILQVLGLFACKMRKSKSFPEPIVGPATGEHQGNSSVVSTVEETIEEGNGDDDSHAALGF